MAHTYETSAVELPDRGLVKGLFGSHFDGTWRADEQTAYFATSVRLRDLTFVLNAIQQMNIDAAGPFLGKLDMTRVAIAGHSMGGATAILAVEQESRYKAGIVLDAILPHTVCPFPRKRPSFFSPPDVISGVLSGARYGGNFKARASPSISGAPNT